jgi:transaldolase
MTKEGVMAAKYFSKGVKTNVTLVFSAGQALLAAMVQLMFLHLLVV